MRISESLRVLSAPELSVLVEMFQQYRDGLTAPAEASQPRRPQLAAVFHELCCAVDDERRRRRVEAREIRRMMAGGDGLPTRSGWTGRGGSSERLSETK